MGKMTVIVCDFCGASTADTSDEQWYRISSLRWPVPQPSLCDDPYELKRLDACFDCGRKILDILIRLNVPHQHTKPKDGATGMVMVL